MLRKRSVSLVSCKYEAVIESAWKQTKVRVWVKKLWSWTLKADRQQAARPSAACRNYADGALLPRLHSTPGPAFSFFSPVVLSPPPGWAGLRSGRADWLHYLGTLNSRHGIVMMTFAARQYLITDHSSLVFRTAFYSTTYSTRGLHLNILWRKCGSVVLFSALFRDCLSEFLFVLRFSPLTHINTITR